MNHVTFDKYTQVENKYLTDWDVQDLYWGMIDYKNHVKDAIVGLIIFYRRMGV